MPDSCMCNSPLLFKYLETSTKDDANNNKNEKTGSKGRVRFFVLVLFSLSLEPHEQRRR